MATTSVFVSKKNGKEVIATIGFENMLLKNRNINNHSYVRYRLARLFNKTLYSRIFANMAKRSSMTQELINRRIEITRDMLGEIKAEYGNNAMKFAMQFL